MSSKSKITWYVMRTDNGYVIKDPRDYIEEDRFTDNLGEAEKFFRNKWYENGVFTEEYAREIGATFIKVEQEVTLTVVG